MKILKNLSSFTAVCLFLTSSVHSDLPNAINPTHFEGLCPEKQDASSFQICALIDGEIEIFTAKFPSDRSSKSPATIADAIDLSMDLAATLPQAPESWAAFKNKQMITVGNHKSFFSVGARLTQKHSYTKLQVWDAVLEQMRLSEVNDKDTLELIHLYTVMTHLDIETITHFPTKCKSKGIIVTSCKE